MVTLLSHRLGTMQIQDSCQRNESLPIAAAGLDPQTVKSILKVKQTHNNSSKFPLQACIREAASRGEKMQGF